jgi:hypothetical protein
MNGSITRALKNLLVWDGRTAVNSIRKALIGSINGGYIIRIRSATIGTAVVPFRYRQSEKSGKYALTGRLRATQKFSTIQALLSPGVGISKIP